MSSMRVRYAPSPTGLQHIGGIRTALFNFLLARSSSDGVFIVRIEDTDRSRYERQGLADIFESLQWLGLEWDEGPVWNGEEVTGEKGEYGPYSQSERRAHYRKYAEQLVEAGYGYWAYDPPEELAVLQQTKAGYDRRGRHRSAQEIDALKQQGVKPVVRFLTPQEGSTTIHDILLGDITRKNRDVSPDPVLLKSDGYPTYHLASVVDDHLMKISHVLRAQEWLSSTPLHILLYEAFGWELPQFCHLPVVLGKDGKKLSKRHGAASVAEFRQDGYLAEAMMNYVAMLGWSHDGVRELFGKDELMRYFSLDNVNRAPTTFDYAKLNWYNGLYIRELSNEALEEAIAQELAEASLTVLPLDGEGRQQIAAIAELIRPRLTRLSDVVPMVRFLFDEDDEKDSDVRRYPIPDAHVCAVFTQTLRRLAQAPVLNEADLRQDAADMEIKFGHYMMCLRLAITHSKISPPLLESMELLGVDKCIKKIENEMNTIDGRKEA